MRKFLVFFAFIPVSMNAQVNQIWTDINLQHKMSDRWSWTGDAGARFTLNQSLSAAYARGGIMYHASPKFTFFGGLAYFFYNSSPAGITGHEFRPWQGARLDLPIGKRITFTNYTRLEQRFITMDGSTDFFLRFRNLTGLSVIIFQNDSKTNSLYIPVSFEFFEDLNTKFFVNRHRTYFGTGYAFSKNRIEIHYILQQGRLNTTEDFELTENIYRLRWFRTI